MTPKQTVESIYDAFTRADVPHILGLVAPHARWHQSAFIPWGGTYSGPAGAADFFTKLNQFSETTGFEVRENIEVGSEVFSFGTHRCIIRATGKPASVDFMFRWRIEHGSVVSYESYVDSAAVTAAMA